jgi:putative Mg2+ transporter-C (MgtC) family protein
MEPRARRTKRRHSPFRLVAISRGRHARIIEGVIVGVGFIGGGAIIKKDLQAVGTATAASLWATGAFGGAVGYGLYDIAAILSLSIYVIFRNAAPLKSPAQEPDEHAHRDRM